MTPPDTAYAGTARTTTASHRQAAHAAALPSQHRVKKAGKADPRLIAAEYTDLARLADLFGEIDSTLESSDHSWRTELGLWD